MARILVAGLFSDLRSNAFGLHDSQISDPDLVHNGGWYNMFGQKLGWGDLSPAQIFRISQEIDGDELFIVLGEHDSFWNFVMQPGLTGEDALVDRSAELRPGIEYVWKKCLLMIKKDDVMVIYDRGEAPTGLYSPLIPNHRWASRNEALTVIRSYMKKYLNDLDWVARMFAAFR